MVAFKNNGLHATLAGYGTVQVNTSGLIDQITKAISARDQQGEVNSLQGGVMCISGFEAMSQMYRNVALQTMGRSQGLKSSDVPNDTQSKANPVGYIYIYMIIPGD